VSPKRSARAHPARPRRPTGRGRPAARGYRIAPGIAHREVAGQTLLLGPGPGTLYTLNATGQLVWRRLQRGQTPDAIAEALRRAFGITRAEADRDVRAFLEDLRTRGFVVGG
jgi:coenzyme PQQ synthesis protein D (PqqD)